MAKNEVSADESFLITGFMGLFDHGDGRVAPTQQERKARPYP